MTSSKRITINEVAKAAGVSATAVSFAFNKPGQLGADTVVRILAAARELGYSPDPIARALASRSTGIIGVLVPSSIEESFANPFISAFMQGVGRVCDVASLSALVVSPLEGSLENAVNRAPVDGYIVLGLNENHSEIEPLRRRRVPFVVVDGDAETVSSVNVDDRAGAYLAIDYLLRQGPRDILIVIFNPPPRSHDDDASYGVGGRRLAGCNDAFRKHGMLFEQHLMIRVPTTMEGGAAALAQALDGGWQPGAVFAVSDAMALGVMAEATRRGIAVPGDMEVIGFDDVPLGALVQPSLSTVHQPIVEKGQIAASMLIRALEGTNIVDRVVLPASLVLRESTRH